MNIQLEQLRKKIRILCPDHQQQILKMNKQDLIQLLQQSSKLSQINHLSNVIHHNQQQIHHKTINNINVINQKQIKKQISIRQKIINLYPEIDKQMDINLLDQQQLKEIYQHAIQSNPLLQNNHMNTNNNNNNNNNNNSNININNNNNNIINNNNNNSNNNKSDFGKEDKYQVKQQKKKKTFNSNGVVNSNQMKKVLIQKIPQYRNQILNLSDVQMQKMYNKMLNNHQDEVYIPKNQKKIQFQSKPKPNDKPFPSYFNYHSPTQQHISKRFAAMNNHLNKSQLNKYTQPQILIDDDINQNNINIQQFNNDYDFLRKRGRPRKIKQDTGFNYDNAPNFGHHQMRQPNGYANNYYQIPNYLTNLSNQIHADNLQFNSNNQNINAYDDSPIMINKPDDNDLIKQHITPQKMSQKYQISAIQNQKQQNKKYRCKITFYLNQSDLQQDNKQQQKNIEKQKKQQKHNNQPQHNKQKYQNILSSVINNLHQSFKNKNWQIQ